MSMLIVVTIQPLILKELIESGQIGIVGGIHDITTGHVTFLSETIVLHSNREMNFDVNSHIIG